MTESQNKPITNAQRRAAEKLLDQEAERLWQEFQEEFYGDRYGRLERQARQEWLDANPAFVEVASRATTYAKRANKRLLEFAEEAAQAAPDVEWVHATRIYISSTPEVERGMPSILSPSIQAHPNVKAPWEERSRELLHEYEKRMRRVQEAITERIAKGRRDILLATLGAVDKDLITLPTLAEIVTQVEMGQ